MLALFFELTHRVLLTRYTGSFTSKDIDATDAAVIRFVGREGPVRGILDFSEVDAFNVSKEQWVARARQPQIAAGQERVFIVNKPELVAAAQVFVMLQQELGGLAPRIVSTQDEANTSLGMLHPEFVPLESLN